MGCPTPRSLIESALGSAGSEDPSGRPPEDAGKLDPVDADLERIASGLSINIKLVGCGGAGSNTISRCTETGLTDVQMLAINTDAKHLLSTRSQRKMLIGKRLTRGLGAGAQPEVGERAAMENEEELRDYLRSSQIVFVIAGMGGGTGTSSSAYVASLAKDANALTIGVVTLPFTSEGELRMENAVRGLNRLADVCDTTIVIPNDTLIQLVPRLPIQAAFKVADEILVQTVSGLTEMLTHAGLVNVDYADLRTVLDEGGVSLIGVGESAGSSRDRIAEALDEAVSSPLLGKMDLSDARGAVVRVVGGPDMSLDEAAAVAQRVSESIRHDARLIWGCSIDPALEGRVKVLLVATGARSQYVLMRGDAGVVSTQLHEDYRGSLNLPPNVCPDEDLSMFVR
jgi:cell division protein FtsZ